VNTTAGKHGPDVWVILRENFTASPCNVTSQWRGSHGGASWETQHTPLIISGLGIRQGIQSQFPARSIDVTPTIETLLGLPAVERPGVVWADALVNATTAQVGAKANIEPGLQADVRGLEEQSPIDSDDSGYRACRCSPAAQSASSGNESGYANLRLIAFCTTPRSSHACITVPTSAAVRGRLAPYVSGHSSQVRVDPSLRTFRIAFTSAPPVAPSVVTQAAVTAHLRFQ